MWHGFGTEVKHSGRTGLAVGSGPPPLSGLGSGSRTLSCRPHYPLHDLVCGVVSTDLTVLHGRRPCLHSATWVHRAERQRLMNQQRNPLKCRDSFILLMPSPCSSAKNFLSPSPPRPGRDLVRVRSPGTPLASLSPPLRLVLSTAFMCSCSATSSAWPRPWGCSLSWLPLGALLLLLEPYRPHWRGETEWKRIRIWQLVFKVF